MIKKHIHNYIHVQIQSNTYTHNKKAVNNEVVEMMMITMMILSVDGGRTGTIGIRTWDVKKNSNYTARKNRNNNLYKKEDQKFFYKS